MSEPKFTSGPWHAGHLGQPDMECQCAYVIDEGHAGGICTVHVHNGIVSIADGGNDAPSLEQAIANMHLIAAAPNLYAALQAAIPLLDDNARFLRDIQADPGNVNRAFAGLDVAVKALAKARGEASS